jgi:TPR repeat protein
MAAAIFIALATIEISEARPPAAAGSVFQSAERGNPQAQTQLGVMYEKGVGVPQDYYLAAQWYHRAAEQGDPQAQHRLGILFNKGFGVRVNFIEAYKWLNLAAARMRTSDRGYYARIRDAVASKLSYAELSDGQLRASLWRPKLER